MRIPKSFAGVCVVGGVLLLTMAGCGEDHSLTNEPVAVDIYVDSTFSNDQVAGECMDDVMTAAKLAAGSRGSLKFHTFDGDPFRRRGLSESFGDEAMPADIEGTSGETAFLEEQAEELEPKLRKLTEERPKVPGSPLVELLERIARHPAPNGSVGRVLICTDGLFTDINPKQMNVVDARSEGTALPPTLHGMVIDFIGLDGSAPERGKWIERTKPLVSALLAGAGASLGNWDLELPPGWREELIEIANAEGSS